MLGSTAGLAYFITWFAIFISMIWFLLPRDPTNQNWFMFTAAGVYRVATVKQLTVHYHSADYTYGSFGITEFIFDYLKTEFRLSRCKWCDRCCTLQCWSWTDLIKSNLLFWFLWWGPHFQWILLIRTYLSLLQLAWCRRATVQYIPVHRLSAYYIV